jgi:hypothetical protein
MLEKIPLPGNPTGESERKALWMKLPRRARIAIRRLHRNFKHLPKQAMVQMLRASRAPKIYIDAAKAHRCNACETTKPKPPTHKVSMPKPCEFNSEIGVDVFDIKDAAGTFYDILNVVDYGTTSSRLSLSVKPKYMVRPVHLTVWMLSAEDGLDRSVGPSPWQWIEARTTEECSVRHLQRRV